MDIFVLYPKIFQIAFLEELYPKHYYLINCFTNNYRSSVTYIKYFLSKAIIREIGTYN